jgi:Flp pilus assembly protein TadG
MDGACYVSQLRLLEKFCSRLARFGRDDRGSIAIIAAMVGLLLVCLTFGVLDVTRASNARQRLQDALDAATLAAARSGATDDAGFKAVGQRYLALRPVDVSDPGLTSDFKQSGGSIVGTASGYLNPIILGLFIKGPMPVSAVTSVMRDTTLSTEIALVLDTTASMSGSKITTLQAAAKDLVQKVMKGNNPQVKVGVVPFADYVNIGVSRRNETWAAVPADYSVNNPGGVCTDNTKTTCLTPSQPYTCTTYNDGVPNLNGTCYTAGQGCTTVKTGTQSCTKPSVSNYVFYGCVGSPPYPKNVRDDDPTRKYPGFLNVKCTQEFTPLTSDQATVVTATQTLAASGNTYIPAGLAWGFNMLSSATPMTEAAAYDATGTNQRPRKALILMTDGANSNKMNANGSTSSVGGAVPTQANQYSKELCDNIKAQKIEVFTVAFTITDPTAKALVQYCATDAAHYYDATDNVALTAAFQSIADALQQMRISH